MFRHDEHSTLETLDCSPGGVCEHVLYSWSTIDNSYKCIRFIKKTAEKLEIKVRTKKTDYLLFLKNNNEKFNIIFADPPYRFLFKDYIEIIDIVRDNGILEEGGELIIEHRSNISFIDQYKEVDERNYGSSSLSFFKKASL